MQRDPGQVNINTLCSTASDTFKVKAIRSSLQHNTYYTIMIHDKFKQNTSLLGSGKIK